MDVDQELAAALAVDPSPEFVARVRTHIAHLPVPADRNPSMMLVATGSAILGIVLALALSQVDKNRSGSASIKQPAALPLSVAASGSPSGAVSTTTFVKKAPPVRKKDPQVLVPAYEASALRELFAAVHDGHVDLTALAEDASYTIVETDLRSMTVIPPVSVELVQAMTNSGGVRQ